MTQFISFFVDKSSKKKWVGLE